jgi:hypothetical protein
VFYQSRFLTDWLGRSSANPSIWWIPVSYTDSNKVSTDVNTMPRLWMNDTSASLNDLPDKDSWLLLNINATGIILSSFPSIRHSGCVFIGNQKELFF